MKIVNIPSQDKCFIKCYNFLKKHSITDSEYTEYKFENFIFNTQKKSKRNYDKISKFNKHFNDSLQYYNPKGRHLYPKLKEKSENKVIIYFHFDSENDSIGH